MGFEIDKTDKGLGAKIKLIGVGGCGGNAVNNMIERRIEGVEFIVCNTDVQALENSKAPVRVQIGKSTTSGLGAGAEPSRGRQAAEEDREEISELIRGCDMVFITAGMGKGTGTGAAPVLASIAKNLGVLTIGIVTMPFKFEGRKKWEIAENGIAELRKHVDTLIVVQNEKILNIASDDADVKEAYDIANDVLYRAAKGISDIITKHGHVNVDFADVKGIMTDAGDAVMGSSTAAGENRAMKAAMEAISSPLLDGVSIKGATGVLVNITGDVKMRDMAEAMSYIEEEAGSEAKIINGYVQDNSVPGEISITVIATGFNKMAGKPQHATGKPIRVVRQEDQTPPPRKPEENRGNINTLADDLHSGDEAPAFIKQGRKTYQPSPENADANLQQDENPQPEQPRPYQNPSPGQDRIRKSNTDTPAFLRKIMD
ncbi:cell division protein FtsZ [Chloroherpeton thalassium ATCC 35110]|uniref:Cell division protein FtsZ n=1 Tax=Chloroherpeton thalassium (strain ATCC 35110 / GB-78) TaxID=517418 RepID=B3QWU3_CHLT3|nr:cell division protein FtsZ [Chloroherpeton thalassium]ACF13307.1 cell division protein FtsZ [Chloroherpeton thalassium ATCC 35110]